MLITPASSGRKPATATSGRGRPTSTRTGLLELTESHEAIAGIINVARYTHGDDIAAYLCYMSIRLLEIHRVLKPTGSLYLHCDNNVNTCLGELLTAIFGADNFRQRDCLETHQHPQRRQKLRQRAGYYLLLHQERRIRLESATRRTRPRVR